MYDILYQKITTKLWHFLLPKSKNYRKLESIVILLDSLIQFDDDDWQWSEKNNMLETLKSQILLRSCRIHIKNVSLLCQPFVVAKILWDFIFLNIVWSGLPQPLNDATNWIILGSLRTFIFLWKITFADFSSVCPLVSIIHNSTEKSTVSWHYSVIVSVLRYQATLTAQLSVEQRSQWSVFTIIMPI